MSIKRLPEEAATQIQASGRLRSLNSVICGLVKNSLDAGASQIQIHVWYRRRRCEVDDNGLGIPPSEFREEEGLLFPNSTSKYPPSQDIHGKDGQFLFALSCVSILRVTSHHHEYHSHNEVTAYDGLRKLGVPAPEERKFLTFPHGTKARVWDLFRHIPVRVEQIEREIVREGTSKLFDELVLQLRSLIIAWPNPVSVSLSEVSQSYQRASLSTEYPTAGYPSQIQRISRALSQVHSPDLRRWAPLSISAQGFQISGCVSLTPVATKCLQFISLGVEPLSNEHHSNVLYETINHIFTNSTFGSIDHANVAAGESPPSTRRDNPPENLALKKDAARWPVFCLNIRLTSVTEQTRLLRGADGVGNQRNLEDITDLVGNLFYWFLQKHHFNPKWILDPGKMTWLKPDVRSTLRPASCPPTFAEAPLAKKQRRSKEHSGLVTVHSGPETSRSQRPTNHSHRGIGGSARGRAAIQAEYTMTLPQHFPLGKPLNRPTPNSMLVELFSKWKNPVFEDIQPPVRRVGAEELSRQSGPARHRVSFGGQFDASTMGVQVKISRSELEKAEVLGQISNQMILAKVSRLVTSSGRSADAAGPLRDSSVQYWIAIDQHAADERCRVEELMKSYFRWDPIEGAMKAVTTRLQEPLCIELREEEADLLFRFRDHFENWGVREFWRQDSGLRESEGISTVKVQRLPPAILARCCEKPQLLEDILRKEIWFLHDNPEMVIGQQRSAGEGEQPSLEDWFSRFTSCPAGISDMLESRACRSAIMFNDPLSLDECRDLLRRLTKCALPFQCCHGRPTVVPVVNIA